MSKRITTKPRLKAKALCKDRCLWHSLGAQGANLHRPCTLVRPGRKKKNGQKPLGGPGEKDTHTVYKNEFVGQGMRQVVKRKTIVLANAVFRTRLEIQDSGARSRLCAFDALETRRATSRSFIQHASGGKTKSQRDSVAFRGSLKRRA